MDNYFEPVLTDDQLRAISSIGLAHMGDAVFELLVRRSLCVGGKTVNGKLHKETIARVCAPAQAAFVGRIMPHLTEEETAVYKRGRNAHVSNIPKNATASEYGKATGLEALFGWLWLRGEKDRLNELFERMMVE